MSKCFFFTELNFCETGVRILSVGETNFGFLRIGRGVNPVVSLNRTRNGNVLLFGHPLREEGPCTKAQLTVVITEGDRSLRRVKRLNMGRRLVRSGGGRHGKCSSSETSESPLLFDLGRHGWVDFFNLHSTRLPVTVFSRSLILFEIMRLGSEQW